MTVTESEAGRGDKRRLIVNFKTLIKEEGRKGPCNKDLILAGFNS